MLHKNLAKEKYYNNTSPPLTKNKNKQMKKISAVFVLHTLYFYNLKK